MKFSSLLLSASAVMAIPSSIQQRSLPKDTGIYFSVHYFPETWDYPLTKLDYNDNPAADPTSRKVIVAFSDIQPQVTGITHQMNFHTEHLTKAPTTIYNKVFPSSWYYCVNHEFYISAPSSGKYSINLHEMQDNFSGVWVGRKAYYDYSFDNADLRKWMSAGTISFKFDLKAGEIAPVRILNINALYGSSCYITVTGPSGEELISLDRNLARNVYPKLIDPLDSMRGYRKEKLEHFPRFPFPYGQPPKIKSPKSNKHTKVDNGDDDNNGGNDNDNGGDDDNKKTKKPKTINEVAEKGNKGSSKASY